MAHVHAADSGERPPASGRARLLLALALAPFLAAAAAGMVLLWPDDVRPTGGAEMAADQLDATVTSIDRQPCEGTQPGDDLECERIGVRLTSGPDADTVVELPEQSAGGVDLDVGDRVVVGHYPDAPEGFRYALADFQRDRPLLVLALLFGVAVVALGRWLGLRALVAVGLGLAVLVVFVLPTLLEGADPVPIALVGSAAVATMAIYLSHGFSARSSTALLGTLISLAIVAGLAWVFVQATELSGLADEDATLLQLTAGQIDLQGLLLAGMVIGALGVLDDVTVTQVAAVWELRRANPDYRRRELYGAGVRIGRDHIASAVNTLVLAYAGASLPMLLLFTQAGTDLLDVLTTELVATEVVRTLTGSIGLVASVPITTGLAVLVAGRTRGDAGVVVASPSADAGVRAAERTRATRDGRILWVPPEGEGLGLGDDAPQDPPPEPPVSDPSAPR